MPNNKTQNIVRKAGLSLVICLISFSSVAQPIAEKFFIKSKVLNVVISPNGKQVVRLENEQNSQILVLQNITTKKTEKLLDLAEFSKDKASITGLTWQDDKRLLAQFSQVKKGVEDLLDTRRRQFLLSISLPEGDQPLVVKSVRTSGWLVNPLAAEDDAFLYAKSGIYSKVYRLKPSLLSPHKKRLGKLSRKDGGQFKNKNEVVSVEGYAYRWFFNNQGKPSAVLHFDREEGLTLSNFDEKGKVQKLKNWPKEKEDEEKNTGTDVEEKTKRLLPVSLAEDSNSFYCLDFNEEYERSVYKVNFKTSEETLVYEADAHKIVNLIVDEKTRQLLGVKVINDGAHETVFIEAESGAVNIAKPKQNKSMFNTVISRSQDGSRTVVYSEAFNQAGQFFIKNTNDGQQHLLASSLPSLKKKFTSIQKQEKLLVDGIEIPYLLNLPSSSLKNPVPLIVYPHGGPIGVFDGPYFESDVQFMNAKGFAVLRVNYRGSSGFGSQLKDAGTREWGGKILKDIIAVTEKVTKQKDIDQKKVCILGASYGGYAATMLTITHPQLFQCGVTIAGVSDVNLYLNSPYKSDRQDVWLKKHVGDTVGDYQTNKDISPLYQIADLKRPLMIMHGEKDEVVDLEHAYRLKLMLDKYRKNYKWKIFPEMGHSFSSAEATSELFTSALAFIEENIK